MTPGLLLHGGAGARSTDAAHEALYREGLGAAARAGRDVLMKGGDSLEAVVTAVRTMEAHGRFNAGAGACLDEEGQVSLDAAVMRGRDRAAGAVGALRATSRAADVALDLLREGRYVLLVGDGADRRAQTLKLPPLEPPDERRKGIWEKLRAAAAAKSPPKGSRERHDTVGAVALDDQGHLAAAVSTGGLWLKARGRVGDAAVIGAGLFACDELGAACVATGIGERMIRAGTCRLVVDRGKSGATAAAKAGIDDVVRRFGADSGGVIVVDKEGRFATCFDTAAMGRALVRPGEEPVVAVLRGDPFPADV